LEEALEKIFRIGKSQGIARKNSPTLTGVMWLQHQVQGGENDTMTLLHNTKPCSVHDTVTFLSIDVYIRPDTSQ
jgi:hypothetical protein